MSGFNHVTIDFNLLAEVGAGPTNITEAIDFSLCLNKKPIYLVAEHSPISMTILMDRLETTESGVVQYSGQYLLADPPTTMVVINLTFVLETKQVLITVVAIEVGM